MSAPGTAGSVRRSSWRRRLLFLTAATALFAAYVFLTGGIDARIAGIPIRSRSWQRPATIAAVLSALLLWLFRDRVVAAVLAIPIGRLSRWVPLIASAWALAAGLAFGTFAAGGADSAGYVTQAELLARGRLTTPVPREPWMSWPDVPGTLTPLGYSLYPPRTSLSPTYPPGLPLLMAPFAMVHSNAVFVVVPLCAAIAVWLCYRLGRQLGEPTAGAFAALLLSVSPTFLSLTVQPMSDVPVTTFWIGSLVLARLPQRWAPAAAGLTASVAILIRPNLAPVAALVAAACVWTPQRWAFRRGLLCVLAMLPGVLALGAIQHARYGSPLASGYGEFSELFKTSHIAPNLARYPRWLTETHTPVIWLWLLAPMWFLRASSVVRSFAVILYAFVIAVFAAYLPYIYFHPEESFYTRFLLPAIPLMLVLAVCTTIDVVRRITPRFAGVTVAIGALAFAVALAMTARDWGVYGLRDVERKYPAVGGYIRDRLPESAFVLAMQHSGSIRYYSGRHILRWDVLDRASLGAALDALQRAGHTPFAALDRDEAAEFRKRFAVGSPDALARMVPIATIGVTELYSFH